jgi:hypothetical protein
MEIGMNHRAQVLWVWGGVLSIVGFTIGWVGLMRFLPPLSPTDSAAQIAHIFTVRRNGIRLGAIFMIAGTMLWVPWAAVVAAQPRRPGRDNPMNAHTQVGSAAVAAAVVIIGQMCWVVAAFRPTRSPDITLALSDMGFIFSIMPFFIFVIWNIALALAIFGDDREVPAYPRWSAYFCVWCAFLYIPGGCLAFFRTGPFAWNGLLAFYVPAVAFFVWIPVMTVLAIQSINRGRPQVPSAPADHRLTPAHVQ